MLRSLEDVIALRKSMLEPKPGECLVDTCDRACHEFAEYLISRARTPEEASVALEAMATAIGVGDVANIQRRAFEVYLAAAAVRSGDYLLLENAVVELFSASPSPDRITLAVITALARAIPSDIPKSEYFLAYIAPLCVRADGSGDAR